MKKIESDDETQCSPLYFNSIFNESNIDDVFKSIYTKVISNIQKSLIKDSCWTIDAVLAGSHYIRLPKILDHTKLFCLIFKNLMITNALNWV